MTAEWLSILSNHEVVKNLRAAVNLVRSAYLPPLHKVKCGASGGAPGTAKCQTVMIGGGKNEINELHTPIPGGLHPLLP